MTRLGRGPVVLGLLVVGLLVVAVATRPWVTAVAPSPGAGTQAVAGVGSGVTAAGALGLVVMAAAGAMLLARRAAVTVLAVVALLAGGATAWSAWRVLVDPVSAALPVVARSAGLTEASVSAGEIDAGPTGWAAAGLVLAGLVVVLALVALVRGGRWQTSRRHERVDPAASTTAGTTAGTADGPAGRSKAAAEDPLADDWDALTRGEDPTARG